MKRCAYMTSWPRSSEGTSAAVHLPLGFADYGEALRLQHRLHALRAEGQIPDTVLTVEHPPVMTIGRRGNSENILASTETLTKEGISVHRVERGGDVTYHGPGQLVVYPIIDLQERGCGLRQYVRNLEQAVIALLRELDIVGERRTGFPGVWVDTRKIASIGVYVKRWVTCHGLALNVCVNKNHFKLIRPCGMEIETVSLDELVSGTPHLNEVARNLLVKMAALFGWRWIDRDLLGEIG
jgi:lipoate-protein ligase B